MIYNMNPINPMNAMNTTNPKNPMNTINPINSINSTTPKNDFRSAPCALRYARRYDSKTFCLTLQRDDPINPINESCYE